jgi:nitrous oxide reductase accessory protein NosL
MTDTQKKIAAAIAAVMQYLKAEEEQAALPSAVADAASAALAGPKLWALNGRQAQMQLRNLMQLRTFGRVG